MSLQGDITQPGMFKQVSIVSNCLYIPVITFICVLCQAEFPMFYAITSTLIRLDKMGKSLTIV